MPGSYEIRVCRGRVCAGERGADTIHERLVSLVRARAPGLPEVRLDRQSCFGRCFHGPNVYVREHVAPPAGEPSRPTPRSALYCGVQPADADEIVERHIRTGQIVERLLRRETPLSPVRCPRPLLAGAPDGAAESDP